jgi:hypothetical protein
MKEKKVIPPLEQEHGEDGSGPESRGVERDLWWKQKEKEGVVVRRAGRGSPSAPRKKERAFQ